VGKAVAGGEADAQSQRRDGKRRHVREHLLVQAIVPVDGRSRTLVGVPARLQEARENAGRKAPAGAALRVGRVGPRRQATLNGMMDFKIGT